MQKGLRWVDAPAADGPHKTLYNLLPLVRQGGF